MFVTLHSCYTLLISQVRGPAEATDEATNLLIGLVFTLSLHLLKVVTLPCFRGVKLNVLSVEAQQRQRVNQIHMFTFQNEQL